MEGSKTQSIYNSRGISDMVAYEFYWHDPVKGYELLGVLPERRKNPARMTKSSIINWGREVFGKSLDIRDVIYSSVKDR